ncbi:Izh3p NDAI_0I02330 [Naumovozyma dairenensis CBS 421]|uniref:ADIPOR-like receptor IZH3 n=1 Tax=Naumovozyma dairenensis (strain ATCC 10597 / BCRC 20456 / CBS 421 / NBRC 0211 / NRRL Y-12639) TaxID=1071378 RepID=G0WG91_NAUDC|nr:hypothetical protein NDAI_0I02330 [Naumovozyma dairenensis CBS 421]CCD26802.1 hypothetical protein NDAI_0I02330 [Naumovozyma dairenensis CBS 421]
MSFCYNDNSCSADTYSSTKMVSQALPYAMDTLYKLGRKGRSNVSRVRKSGRELAHRYSIPRFLYNQFSTIDESDEIEKFDPDTTDTTTSTHMKILNDLNENNNTSYIASKQYQTVISRPNSTTNLGSSQISINSDAATLVNNKNFTNFISSSKQNIAESSSPYNSSSSSTTSSLFSAPTRTSSNTFIEETLKFEKNNINNNNNGNNLFIEEKFKNLEHFTPLSEPSEELKNVIYSFNHPTAFQLGKNDHLHYYQLPFPWRENRYIIYNYRFYDSHKKSLLSIFNWYGWHNESSNIWTHLLGAIYLIYLSIYDFPNSEIFQSEKVPTTAKLIVYLFLFAAIKCLLASVFWHTFNGTSFLKLRSKFACVDYSGITILITASILTTEFVTMYSSFFAMCIYMTISLSLGMFGVFMNWSPKFDRPEARPLRIKFFILLASMGVLSFLHLTYLTNLQYATWLLTPVTNKSIVWYLVGVVFYGSFIPERFRTDVKVDDSIPTTFQLSTDLNIITKNKNIHFRESPTIHSKCNHSCKYHLKSLKTLWWVDYVGCSHTFWHFFVVLGVIGHYNAIIDMFTKRWLMS